jgi:diguanylate cyclase (GGDEF)-like protein
MPYALIAEPGQGQALVYSLIARSEGLETKIVRDGQAALDVLRDHGAPALTLAELALPIVDGFKVIEEIRKLAPEEYAPVVIVSSFASLRASAEEQRERLGISALLPRGTPVEALMRTVKRVLAASASPHGPGRPLVQPLPGGGQREVDEERAEEVRLHRLDQMGIVDEGAEQDEDLRQIVAKVAERFSVPVALISLVLEDKQWFKAHVGLSGHLLENRGSPRDWSFCTHVVQGRAPLVVPDAQTHPVFKNNKLVLEGALRSYAGVPLETPSGDVLGSLCIIDAKPMAITAEDVDQLTLMARHVAGELELRAARKRQQHVIGRMSGEQQKAIHAQPELYTALAYLSAVLDNIGNGVLLLDPSQKVVFANQAGAELLARTTDSLVGRSRAEVLAEAAVQMKDPGEFMNKLRTLDQGPYAVVGEFEMEKPKRRFIRWASKPVDVDGGVGQLTVLTDVTSETDLRREREQLACTDLVTGLMNRRGAEEVLEREASRAQRFGARVSMVLFDLDHFKQVNDRFGHDAGDEVLRAIATTIGQAARGVDVAARWGGDELFAVLPNTGLDGARSFAERVRATVEQIDPRILRGASLSSGCAELAQGESWEEAIRRADVKLNEAKRAGRNRVA